MKTRVNWRNCARPMVSFEFQKEKLKETDADYVKTNGRSERANGREPRGNKRNK